MPDIDMDFDSRGRDEMIRYAAEKYGREHVAQIVTFGTIKARNAVRDAARVLGLPYGVGDRIAKAMPPLVMGRDTPLKYCFEPSEKYADGYKAAADLRAMYDADDDVRKVVDVAKGLEGLKRSDGIHAAAVVITKEPRHRVLADPAQARDRPGPRRRAGRHPVRDARHRGPRPAEDGLPRPAQPRRHHRHRRDGAGPAATPTSTSTRSPSTTWRRSSCCSGGAASACSSWKARPLRALMRKLRPTSFEDVSRAVRPVPAGPDGGQHAQRLRRPQERAQAGRVPAPRPRGGARRHLRPDGVPGVDDAGGPEGGRLHARRRRPAAPGMRQEEPRADRHRAGQVRRRCRALRLRALARHPPVRHHRAVRRLRLQQEPRLRLRPGRLPDGVPQGALPGGVPRLPAHQRQGHAREGGGVHRRVPGDGHPRAHARHQPVGDELRRPVARPRCPTTVDAARRRRPAPSVRAVGRAQRRRGPRRAAARSSATANGPYAELPRVRRPRARAGAQQARRRVADQGRGLRPARPHAPRPARRVRAHRRPPRSGAAASASSA